MHLRPLFVTFLVEMRYNSKTFRTFVAEINYRRQNHGNTDNKHSSADG